MTSGNFLIGEGLSFEGLQKYVTPIMEQKGYSIRDKMYLNADKHDRSILVSIVGEGDLEKGINDALAESTPIIDKVQSEKRESGKNAIAYTFQVSEFSHRDENNKEVYLGKFKMIGVYSDDNTASQLFPSIAQGYILDEVKKKADGLTNKIKQLLDKKLSEL